MKTHAGIWIDHRQAFIVSVGEDGEESKRIESGVEKHVRYSGHAEAESGKADNQRDRQFATHLERYYDDVITHIGDTESILIFGPGEAKGEFEKRLAHKGLAGHVVGVETADKMTDHQVAAKVRLHFRK